MAERRFSVLPDRVGERFERKRLNQYPQRRNRGNHCCWTNDGKEKTRFARALVNLQ
jgi:hypothetical protein